MKELVARSIFSPRFVAVACSMSLGLALPTDASADPGSVVALFDSVRWVQTSSKLSDPQTPETKERLSVVARIGDVARISVKDWPTEVEPPPATITQVDLIITSPELAEQGRKHFTDCQRQALLAQAKNDKYELRLAISVDDTAPVTFPSGTTQMKVTLLAGASLTCHLIER